MTTGLLIHVASTWAMAGVIWTTQLLVYPSMALVPPQAFAEYEAMHRRRISWALALFAPAEALTGLFLVLSPGDLSLWMPLFGGLLLAGLWISTALFYAPLHLRLLDGFDAVLQQRLLKANWVRTLAWSVRGMLALAMVASIS